MCALVSGVVTCALPIFEMLLGEYAAGQRGRCYTHLLSNRRNRHRFNSYGCAVDELKKLLPRNLAYLNPDEMAERGLVNGDWIEIASDNGTIEAIVEADETIRPGVVSMSHGFGGLPEDGDYLANGASANLLISTRSEEHTSELQSLMRISYAVFCLKKKNPKA